jgi:hypothetical protein
MGCCSSNQVDFLCAGSSKELSEMMLRQRDSIQKEIENQRDENKELSSFYTLICSDTENYAIRIENCDFKQNFNDIKVSVHSLYVAVQNNDRSQYDLEKKKLENIINHHDVLEL